MEEMTKSELIAKLDGVCKFLSLLERYEGQKKNYISKLAYAESGLSKAKKALKKTAPVAIIMLLIACLCGFIVLFKILGGIPNLIAGAVGAVGLILGIIFGINTLAKMLNEIPKSKKNLKDREDDLKAVKGRLDNLHKEMEKEEKDLKELFPYDVPKLGNMQLVLEGLKSGRADDFKEAFHFADEQMHREKMEAKAEETRQLAEEALETAEEAADRASAAESRASAAESRASAAESKADRAARDAFWSKK